MRAFDRYAPFIQDYIYQNGWESLRGVQTAAAEVLFYSEDNLLLTASTAAGKTEAAFFPILTLFDENPPQSVGVLYIGPLKALINDQFLRLNDLCAQANIPVWHWHGDVSQSHKQRLLKRPSGILQITPESLEALLLHRHGAIVSLFKDLRFIVIDEVHSLLRGDRGGQTLCLIERLCKLAGVNPRRIGLSATIGDPEYAAQLLSSGSGRRTAVPSIEDRGMRWRLSMEHFYIQGSQASEGKQLELPLIKEAGEETDTLYVEPTDKAPDAADPGYGYVFEHTRGKKCLVFVNSREECEVATSTLRQYCEHMGERDRFLIHHGNLSQSFRETAETLMKDEEQLQTTVTTATLELGIDIGRLERAFQIDAPATVSSFLQRMGRTGRRGQPPEMWFVMREEPPLARALLPESIPWKLIQGIALVQCYLESRWVEPTRIPAYPYSLLYHQTMSTLASCGELSPASLAARVLTLSYFKNISREDYKTLLRHLLSIDHIQQTERGGIIVGLAGERVINSYKFYAVFQENEEYTVRCGSQELGTVVQPPPPGEKLAIAGHVWYIEEVDHKRHLVYCQLVKGVVPAFFGLCPGDIHTRILERMKLVLEEDKAYPYLMKNAVSRLALARHSARAGDITNRQLVNLGGTVYCLFPWLGTYAFMALERFLKLRCGKRLGLKGLDAYKPYYIQFTMSVSENEFWDIFLNELRKPLDPMELLYPKEVPVFNKYDEYLPEELIRKGFAYGVLDIDGIKQRFLPCESLLPVV